jgi:hypothetical protein
MKDVYDEWIDPAPESQIPIDPRRVLSTRDSILSRCQRQFRAMFKAQQRS